MDYYDEIHSDEMHNREDKKKESNKINISTGWFCPKCLNIISPFYIYCPICRKEKDYGNSERM